jgi:hypothetical protein
VSDENARRERIKARIAASQERLELAALSAQRRRLPDAAPPDSYRSLALEYPWLALAAALGGGLLVGALLPRGIGRKAGRRALTVAMVGGELALALSKQAGKAAQERSREGLARLSEIGETVGEAGSDLRQRTVQVSATASGKAREAGTRLAREAIRLAGRVRR